MSADLRIPIVEEQAHIVKRSIPLERVDVHTRATEETVLLRDQVQHHRIETTRVPIDREVSAAPPIRTEGDLTVVPILEERLVVEKRLFLVEELHLRRVVTTEAVELPTTVRRTTVQIDREDLTEQEHR